MKVEELKERRDLLQEELKRITIKKDRCESQAYTFEKYTDPARAKMIETQIVELNRQIDSYPINSHNEQESEARNRQRLYGMPKLKQSLAFRQRQKFKKIWLKAIGSNKKTKEEVAEQLSRLFR